jgi:zinc protease
VKTLARLLAALCWLASAPALAAEAAIGSFTLPNGLEVVVVENHRVPAVSHMIWYRVGATDDPPGKSGLAHFHEHVMFLGTAAYKAGEFSALVARKSGQQNAFTGHDATSYYITIAKEHLGLAMALEADRMRGLTPSDVAVDNEKQVILEERRMRIENNPQALLGEQVDAALFRHHPYRLPVIGWMHEMEGLTKADVLAFHRAWYHPNNAIVIISGDVTLDEARKLATQHYGPLKRATLPERRWNSEPPQLAPRHLSLEHANVKQPVWSRSYATASLAHGDKAQAMPLMLAAQLLGGGKTSRLYQSLVVEKKLASRASVDYSGFNLGPGRMEIEVVPEAGISMDAIEQAVDAELQQFLAKGAQEAELARAKTLLKAESIYAREGLTSMARIMGWLRILGLGSDYFTLWPELVERVSADEVRTAAKAAFNPNQSVTAVLLPTAKPAGEAP